MTIRRRSLGKTVLRKVFTFYLMIAIGVTLTQIIFEYYHTKSLIRGELEKSKATFLPNLQRALWAVDTPLLLSTSIGMSQNPSIVGVRIDDEARIEVAATGVISNAEGEFFSVEENGNRNKIAGNEGLFWTDFPIYAENNEQLIGYGTIYSSNEVIIARVKYSVLLILLNSVIKTFALWFIFLFFFQRLIGKPLALLNSSVQSFTAERSEEEAASSTMQQTGLMHRTDEIGSLATSFDEMQQTILEKFQSLQEIDQLKDDFLVKTSHELHTPLHGIIGIAESLKDNSEVAQSPYLQSNLELIHASGQRLAHLVGSILDFSKLKHQKLTINQSPVDLFSMVEVVIKLSSPLIGEKSLALKNQVPPTLSPVHADEDRLFQILHNLIHNAIKNTAQGSITITAIADAENVHIGVTDTGIGIPQEYRETIFQPFTQYGSTINYQGSGLGLTVTKQLVNLHGGEIDVQPVEPNGSHFSFDLPLAKDTTDRLTDFSVPSRFRYVWDEPAIAEANVDTPDAVEGSGQWKVMVVDDDAVNLQVISNYLQGHNYTVICLDSGEKALEWIQIYGGPDLILLDIMMPLVNGFGVCKTIRQRFSPSDLPVIFLTASHRKADLETGFALGANDYLTKPFDKSELILRIDAHLKILMAKRHMAWLRDYANNISNFKTQQQMYQFALEKIGQATFSTASYLVKNEPFNIEGNFDFLQKWPVTLFIDEHQDQADVIFLNTIQAQDSVCQLYGDQYTGDLQDGHLAYILLNTEYLICIFRSAGSPSFNEMDRQLMLSVLEQTNKIKNNLQSMLSDKLLEAVHCIQPNLSKITHIAADSPFANIYFEGDSKPVAVEISLSNIDLYFDAEHLIKVHKSYLVNPQKIVTVERKRVKHNNYQYEVFLGSHNKLARVPIGRSFVATLAESFPAHFEKFS